MKDFFNIIFKGIAYIIGYLLLVLTTAAFISTIGWISNCNFMSTMGHPGTIIVSLIVSFILIVAIGSYEDHLKTNPN